MNQWLGQEADTLVLPVRAMMRAASEPGRQAAAVSNGRALAGDEDLVLYPTHVRALKIFLVKPPG